MSVKIADLMAKRVISAQPHHSVDHVRGVMERNRIHALPILGPEGEPGASSPRPMRRAS